MAAPDLAFSHIGLYVTDIERMEAFYTRFLGFTVTDRGNLGPIGLVFLSRDPKEHHQIVLASGRPPTLAFNAINQISFRVPDLAALREFHRGLAREAVTEVTPVSHGNALSIYFRDPEGNRIELFLDTPWYVDQPCREPLDLTQSEKDIWAGAEKHARTLPGFKPRAEWEAEMAQRMGRR